MPRATRYPCSDCGNSFVLEFFVEEDIEQRCLFCKCEGTALAEIKDLKQKVALLKDELRETGLAHDSTVNELRQEVALLKGELQVLKGQVQVGKAIREPQSNVSLDDGFTVVRSGRNASAPSVESATVPLQNRFAVLQEEAEPEPDVMLVGDSLVRDQGSEFCREKRRRKFRCYPGQKIEDITERVDYLVENSTEDSMFVTVVGTNNLRCDTATDIVDKYRIMIREFAARRRKVAVCGIIPRYDVGPAMFRKMSVVNRQLEALCRQKEALFFDLWHHFCLDRTLYARDGIHLNCVGKARLGRVIGECLAGIPRPPVAGNGSTSNEVASSVASEVSVDGVAANSDTAPNTQHVARQEEEVGTAEVPMPSDESSSDADFQ